jgi:hypothetical protein
MARSPIRSVRSQIAHERSTVTRVTRVIGLDSSVLQLLPDYAGTASFSFFAASISFCAMCAGTSS